MRCLFEHLHRHSTSLIGNLQVLLLQLHVQDLPQLLQGELGEVKSISQ